MPGGLLQLVATGAQNQVVNGNPSMTFFRTMYKRHTNFAMESVRLDFTNTTLSFPLSGGPSTFQCIVKRVTDLVHDCYFVFDLPDIWSPLYNPGGIPSESDYGYEFRWIENIGYNCIEQATVYVNGVKVVQTTGEWFKLYSYLTHDRNKRDIVDRMVGNTPDLTDPANSYGRMYQYPHAIQVTNPSVQPEPSIRGRQIVVPLHFWFCENVGEALPLIALQNAEVMIELRLRPLYSLFTIQDIRPTSLNGYIPSLQRIAGNAVDYPMNIFLSPPTRTGTPTNPTLTNWFPNPYIEANYIYLTESERAQVAGADQSFLIKEVRTVKAEGQYGPNDLEVPFFNLVTRVVWMAQRNDRFQANDYDNYTNWDDRGRRPVGDSGNTYGTPALQLSSGALQPQSVAQKDILVESTVLLDGKERLTPKPTSYFSLIQHYRHGSGAIHEMPGVYMYSFALDHNSLQPSGAINGSQFNKIILRNTLVQPLPNPIQPGGAGPQPVQLCVYRNTVFNNNPTPVPTTLMSSLSPLDTITVIQRGKESVLYNYTYIVTAYVESYNVLRIVSGIANLVFAS